MAAIFEAHVECGSPIEQKVRELMALAWRMGLEGLAGRALDATLTFEDGRKTWYNGTIIGASLGGNFINLRYVPSGPQSKSEPQDLLLHVKHDSYGLQIIISPATVPGQFGATAGGGG